MFKLESQGFREIEKLLEELPAAVGQEKAQVALHLAADPTAKMAASLCPRSAKPSPRGHLADSIRVFDLPPRGSTVVVVVSYPAYFFWGHFVEWGHRLVRGGYSKVLPGGRVRGPGKQIGFVPAHPFLRPAWDATKGDFLGDFGAYIWAALRSALPSGAGRAAA